MKSKQPAVAEQAVDEDEHAFTQVLCDLAIGLGRVAGSDPADSESAKRDASQHAADLQRCIKKCLNQRNDDALYESLDRFRLTGDDVYRLLRERIEEAAETVLFRRDNGTSVEVNAFVIPLLVRTLGGLDRAQCFEDQEAFDQLADSFKPAQLESQDATVVLISHAYHADEIDGITYTHLHDMVRDAYNAMTAKKFVPTTSIERSFRGWPEPVFGPDDVAVELRFLLGFSLKAADDPFYVVPEDELAADAYFDARATRFEQWAERMSPIVARCLVNDGREIDVHFLYQDLFHGGKERGIAEYFMLQMMAELNRGLEQHDADPAAVRAVIGPVRAGDDMQLRVSLYAQHTGAQIAASDKPVGYGRDLEGEIADARDALITLGLSEQAIEIAAAKDDNITAG